MIPYANTCDDDENEKSATAATAKKYLFYKEQTFSAHTHTKICLRSYDMIKRVVTTTAIEATMLKCDEHTMISHNDVDGNFFSSTLT